MKSDNVKTPAGFFIYGQIQHLLLLACMIPGAIFLALPALGDGEWLGVPDRAWFLALMIVTIAHQVIVWLVWRSQLSFSVFTRLFGGYDLAVWAFIFLPLLLLRLLLLLGLGLSDFGSLAELRGLQILIALILLAPALYTFWSVPHYFGLKRALGADHFRQEYRQMPMVTEGAFIYSSNAMYMFGFLAFWSVALLTGSLAALAAALFQHAYIWVHYYCTEQPDMVVIYGD